MHIRVDSVRVEPGSVVTRTEAVRAAGWAFPALLVASDLAGVLVSFLLAFGLRKYALVPSPLAHGLDVYTDAGLALLLWPLMFSQQGLYPGSWLASQEELRRLAIGTSAASLLAMALTFVTRTELLYSRPIVLGGWFLSLFVLPASRSVTRRLATRIGLSGPPAVILGSEQSATGFVQLLQSQRPPALKPVAIFSTEDPAVGAAVGDVPIVGRLEAAPAWASVHNVGTAVLALPASSPSVTMTVLEGQASAFSRILILSDLSRGLGADIIAHDLKGVLTLELKRNLLSRSNRLIKWALDLALLVLSLVLTLPLAALISVAILIESGRPVIFGHVRIGKGGAAFTAWKFRSMRGDTDQALQKAVRDVPELRAEWEATRKLRVDPRLTRVGRALRRTSLDELPQLWNVFRGQMSLVGPRPIVAEEAPRYGEALDLYSQVLPGLTGLWQVSGRSDTSYAERVRLDTHYVRGWSIWMDIEILARTVWIVLTGSGAY